MSNTILSNEFIAEVRSFNRSFSQKLGIYHQHVLGTKYSLPEARIIGEIGRTPHAWVANQLARHLDMDRSYITRILNKLEKKHLLLRNPSKEDSRKKFLSLTNAGKTVYLELEQRSDAQIFLQFSSLTKRQQK